MNEGEAIFQELVPTETYVGDDKGPFDFLPGKFEVKFATINGNGAYVWPKISVRQQKEAKRLILIGKRWVYGALEWINP